METSVKIRLDEKLKKEFAEAAQQQGNSVAGVLRGFMRGYVELAGKMAGQPFNFKIGAAKVVDDDQ